MLDIEIPAHWKFKKVREIFRERRAKVSDKEYQPLSVSKAGVTLQLETAAKSDNGDNRKLVKVGDFVINSRSDRKGSSGFSNFDGSVSLIYTVLEKISDDNSKFLHYLLRSVPFTETFYRNGKGLVADLWTTNFDKFRNIYLPVPPISEQIQIAAYLDTKTAQIEKFIDARAKQLALLKDLKRAIISETVSNENWQKVRLKYLVENVGEKKNYTGGFYIGLENIESWSGKITASNFHNEEDVESILNSFDERFLLFGKLRPYLAKVAKPNCSGQCTTELLTLLPKEKICRNFLFYVMIETKFIDTVNSSTYGTKMPRASWNFIGNLKIPVPPIEEQKEIAAYLDEKCGKIEKLIETLQKETELAKELQKSLIAEAVTGKIDVGKLVQA